MGPIPLNFDSLITDEVIDDVLRAETDADGDRASRKRKRSQWDAEEAQRRQRDQQEEDEERDPLQDMNDVGPQRRVLEAPPQQVAD